MVKSTFFMMIVTFMVAIGTLSVRAADVEYFAVDVAVTNSPSAQVTFTWDSPADGGSVTISRRQMGDVGFGTWVFRGTVNYPTNNYTDNISPGIMYEYKVDRSAFDIYVRSASYIPVSIDAPLEDDRGVLLFVVDKTWTNALSREIRQIEMDIAADGWTVQRINYDRDGTGSHTNLHALIVQAYNADSTRVKALYLFGHLPIAMSGYLAPDGHNPEAHATDGYYGDIDGTWSDLSNYLEGENVAGDGRFDQSYYPSDIELMVGRVDMSGMAAHYKTEEEHLRDYVHKSHAWRYAERTVPYRGTWASHNMWMEHNWLMSVLGSDEVAQTVFQPYLSTNEVLFGIDFGTALGSAPEYTDVPNKSIFFINFGSFKQKFQQNDNPMRGIMAQPDWGLSCAWGGRPAWFFHHLAAGKPLGYSALRTMNNKGASSNLDYYPIGDYSYMDGYVSINMMGDPTLRMHPVKAPSMLTVAKSGTDAVLAWDEVNEVGLLGYHVYSSTNRLGPYIRLTSDPIACAGYTNTGVGAVETYYQVRTVKRQTTPCGSYVNQSPGAHALLYADGSANTAPTAAAYDWVGSKNLPVPVTFSGTDADGDALCPVILRNPEYGTLRLNDGGWIYLPDRDRVSTDAYVYAMSDGVAWSPPVTCTVDVVDHTLLEWAFFSPTSDGIPQQLTNSWSAVGMETSVLTFGAGLIPDPPKSRFLNDGLCLKSADSSALDTNAYVQCSVKPLEGHTLRLEHIGFGLWAEENVNVYAQLCFSTNHFDYGEIVDIGQTNRVRLKGRGYQDKHGMPFTVDLSGYPALSNITDGVDFRLYLWGAAKGTDRVGLGKLGISNVDVAVAGIVTPTEPGGGDLDNDGIPDDYENRYGGGPTNLNANEDLEGDGLNNFEEYIANTDPTNALSVLKINEINPDASGTNYVITWQSASNRFYRVLWMTNLFQSGIYPLASNLPATPPQNIWTDRTHAAETRGFYRIDVRIQE